ncbi:S-methyl-5'-thioadenosine phosphorylase [Pseudonocardia acaciae]|uniref:S-methyl-5'-thioadenosine phosphorylase n=1 Tax=Pseudonocardia acaciae TaxID=551276 RepID=UPI001B7FF840|nr:S-methyl-5'-thioadenosine phosphorylase [Pseudonocardia acaciae]
MDIAVIGGSGLYRLGHLAEVERISVETPFGAPSDEIVVGSMGGRRIAFLPRHGSRHRLAPAAVPYRANIYALRVLGIRQIVSVSAVGSLVEQLRPGTLAVPDQLVDLTRSRAKTFFDDGCVAHVSPAEPWCSRLRAALVAAGGGARAVHDGGAYCCIDGPAFSTRAESNLYRRWQLSMIGMTAAPEAVLAREANACLAVLALITDYDCWRVGEAPVSADAVAEVMRRNVDAAQGVIAKLAVDCDEPADCTCWHALDGAVLTDSSALPASARERIELFRTRRVGS